MKEITSIIYLILVFSCSLHSEFKGIDCNESEIVCGAFEKRLSEFEILNDQELKHQLIKEMQFEMLYEMEKSIFEEDSCDSMFILHYKFRELVKNYAEYIQMVDELFSTYFIKDIGKSLEYLEIIKDNEVLNSLQQSAVFREGNGEKIFEYIENNNLSNKSYYNLFVIFKSK